MKPDKKLWSNYFFILIILIVFMCFFSSSTSPLFDNCYGMDSAYYRFIGLSILKGKTPYLDVWENKGPVFYLIQAIGALNGTRNGKISLIFPMQIFALAVSIFFLERIDFVFHVNGKRRMLRFTLFIVCSLPLLALTMAGGNLTEEWSLPFISCSLYFFAKYAGKNKSADNSLESKNFDHPRSYAFIHGINFAMVAFIRINNAITICAGIIVIGIGLMIRKQWKNLFENFCFGLAGITVIAFPVFIWFLSKHALGEMLYVNYIYGFKYADVISHNYLSVHDMIVRFFPMALSCLLILIHLLKEREVRLIDFISLAIVAANTCFFVIQSSFLHYFTIIIPVFLFVLIIYLRPADIPGLILIIAFSAFLVPDCRKMISDSFRDNQNPEFPTAKLYVPKSERNSMIAIGVQPEIYLIDGMFPCSRFAAFQLGLFYIEPKFKDEFITSLETEKPVWIVVPRGGNLPYPDIQNIIDTEYSVNFSEIHYAFYRRNN